MSLKQFQSDLTINNLYQVSIAVPSGLGDILKPRITNIGGNITIYGSEKQPAGLTLANISTKMALIVTMDSQMKMLDSIPNYICVVQNSGTSTELVVSALDITSLQVIS